MGGQLKNRTPVGVNMRKDLYVRLKNYSGETMIPMSRLIDKAVEEYLDRNDRKLNNKNRVR